MWLFGVFGGSHPTDRTFIFLLSLVDTETDTNTPSNGIDSVSKEPVDISVFDGETGMLITIDIEKEPDSHLLGVSLFAENISGKDISKAIAYFVKCYDQATPLDSWEYSNRITLEEIAAGDTGFIRTLLGTTTQGARGYRIDVAYILYADGTEWGTPEINHKAIVTRGAEGETTYTEVDEIRPLIDFY